MIFNEDNGGNHVQNTYTNPTAITPAGHATVIVANTAQTNAATDAPSIDAYDGNSRDHVGPQHTPTSPPR